jgi:hypothetical protein
MMASKCWPLRGTERRELSLDEALSDPLIRAVMAADHVDPARLAADLDETRRHLRRISS